MNNKRSLTRLVAVVLLLVVVALAVVSGAFAKYTQEYTGTDTAIVAKWNVTLSSLNSGDEITEFDLFEVSKIYDLKGVAANANFAELTGADDTDVANGSDVAIVAPGTWGKVGFQVDVEDTNEVSVNYYMNLDSIVTTLPLQFSTDGTTWKKASDLVGADGYELANTTVNPKTAKTDTVVLYWRWLFEDGADADEKTATDVADTQLGSAGTATCAVTASFGAVQVD